MHNVTRADNNDNHRGVQGRGLMKTTVMTALLSACTMMTVTTNAAVAQTKTVKIGFVSTFSGPTASIGNDMRNSFELALDHLGRKMGGKPGEGIYADDGQKPAR